jgi:hypothetical protein
MDFFDSIVENKAILGAIWISYGCFGFSKYK